MAKETTAWWKQATQMVQEAAGQAEKFRVMVEQLADRDPKVYVPARWALQQAGPVVIPVLLAGLQHPHPKVRRGCVDVIDHGGYGGDARCGEALLLLLHDWVPHIRRAVWHTLFCERCVDQSQCEIGLSEALDQVGLIIEIGLQDTNLKLRRQLVADLSHHLSDPRVQPALEKVRQEETDPQILAVVQISLGESTRQVPTFPRPQPVEQGFYLPL